MPLKGEALKRYRREWYLKNRDKIIERGKARHAANPSATVQRVAEWRKKNPDKRREHNRRHQKKAAARVNARTAEYRARKRRAKPKWYGELDKFVLLEAMRLARMRKHTTGLDWHVDHIVPLKGRKVCGLHVWNNFRVILATENRRKSNSFHPY